MRAGRFFTDIFPEHPFADLVPDNFPADEPHSLRDPEVLVDMVSLVKPQLIIEVGSWKGHSANLMAHTCKRLGLDCKIICVDTWLGSVEHYTNARWLPLLHLAHGRPALWERFVGNTLRGSNHDCIYPLALPPATASAVLAAKDVKADLIYIDASHEYEDVLADLRRFFALLEPAGLMFGDDFLYRPLARAVREFAEQVGAGVARKGNKWVLPRRPGQLDEAGGYQLLAVPSASLPASDGPPARTHRRIRSIVTADPAFAASLRVAPAFDGQDRGALLGRFTEGGQLPPTLNLSFTTLSDGYFWIRPGQDGVLFARDGTPIASSLGFRSTIPLPDRAALARKAVKLDFDAFIAVDPWWNNYYHWLCIALPKMLAAKRARVAFRPVVPEYRSRKQGGWQFAYSETVWEQSLAVSGLADDVVRLPPGIYTSARVATVMVDHAQPAYLACFDGVTRAYDGIRRRLRTDPASPKRIVIRRRDHKRMSAEESGLVETVAAAHGFVAIELEDLDFIAQAELFFNAEAVIGAHGAGLGNLVFGGKELRVLEINRRCSPGETYLRPWFFLIARDRGQYYSFLNADAGDLERGKIETAIRRIRGQ